MSNTLYIRLTPPHYTSSINVFAALRALHRHPRFIVLYWTLCRNGCQPLKDAHLLLCSIISSQLLTIPSDGVANARRRYHHASATSRCRCVTMHRIHRMTQRLTRSASRPLSCHPVHHVSGHAPGSPRNIRISAAAAAAARRHSTHREYNELPTIRTYMKL